MLKSYQWQSNLKAAANESDNASLIFKLNFAEFLKLQVFQRYVMFIKNVPGFKFLHNCHRPFMVLKMIFEVACEDKSINQSYF